MGSSGGLGLSKENPWRETYSNITKNGGFDENLITIKTHSEEIFTLLSTITE